MKIFIGLLLIIFIMDGCKQKTEDDMINSAVLHFSGVFITENIHAGNQLHIKGETAITKKEGNIFHVTGMVEEFSPMNYPVGVEDFSETLHFLGGDLNEPKNWECIEIYVGNKKMK